MTPALWLRLRARRLRNRVRLGYNLVRARRRFRELAAAPQTSGVHVFYGWETLPPLNRPAGGGIVKFQHLARSLPNTPLGFNVLYLGSSAMPSEAAALVRVARRRGAAFVWNQNGVAYPGWHGPGWQLENAPRARLFRAADYVFYQSAFCRLSAERWYGAAAHSWEVLHNPVDTTFFVPPATRDPRPLTLLLGGSQYQWYRVEIALQTLRAVLDMLGDARLVVTGDLSFVWQRPEAARQQVEALVDKLGLRDHVELRGPYAQHEAPALFRSADILLHTKVNDPCPTVVLESMACAVPVVYSASGGTPELVGHEAGVGVPAVLDWEHDHPPTPFALAQAVLRVYERLDEYAAAARDRAVSRFDLQPWVERHQQVFEELVS